MRKRSVALALMTAGWSGGCGLLLGLDEYGPQTEAGPLTCEDGIKDDRETDIDCGGGCPRCADAKGCIVGTDCESNVCVGGTCRVPACDDGVKNGVEADLDCGSGCEGCGPEQSCGGDGDCKGGACVEGACAPTCTDSVKSGEETDADCGGPACSKCEDGEGCLEATDCESGVCHAGVCVPEHVWSARFGDAEEQRGTSIAIDTAGNVLIAGEMRGTVDFGGGPLASTGAGNVFVVKRGSSGDHLWSKRFTAIAVSQFARVAADASGNLVVLCNGEGGVDFGGGPKGGMATSVVYVAKLDAGGNHIWSKGFSGLGLVGAYDLVLDESGNIVVAGTFTSTINFGGNTLSNGDNFPDIFVIKLDNKGEHLWSKSFPSNLNVPPFSMSTGSSGDLVLAGLLRKTIDFGGGPLTSAGSDDVFVAKLSASGVHVWSKRFGDPAAQTVRSVAVDEAGGVLLAGGFQGSLDFGGGPLVGAGETEIFVAKLSAAGGHVWSERFGPAGANGASASAVASDGSGSVVLAGSFSGTVDFGGGPLTSAGGSDVFALKLDAMGKHVWSGRFGDGAMQDGGAMSLDGSGNLVTTGGFEGSINFGGGGLTSAGKRDVFVAKIAYP